MIRQGNNAPFSQRQLRVGELIKQSLGQIFLKDEAKVPVLETKNITVTEVRMSPDLKNARAYVIPLGGKDTDKAVGILTQFSHHIRKALSKKVDMKFLPKVSFVSDKSFDYAEKIEKLIKSIGLFRNKAKSVYLLSKQLIEKHNGKVPNNFEDLHALPGVGRKTASVVLNEGFGLPTIAVDTHVFRVSNRTGLAYGKNPDEVQKKLYEVVPKKYLKKAGHTILLHGRYTCKARAPSCKTCIIIKYCKYKYKEL